MRYPDLVVSGELQARVEALTERAVSCSLCPRACGVAREEGERGRCKVADTIISGYGPHFGEEKELVGWRGSGTVFFSGCNLDCVYCQNYETSRLCEGKAVSEHQLAEIMLWLDRRGCHNINLVTPTPHLPVILTALSIAALSGLSIPLVYNSGGYEDVEVLKLLDGVIDIYLPDIKYGADEQSSLLSGVTDYWSVVTDAVREMQRQVGDMIVNEQGVARRGLMIRHLILPGDRSHTRDVFDFIARDLGPDTYVNIMGQYRPYGQDLPDPLHRPLQPEEFRTAVQLARDVGLTNIHL